MLDGYAKLPNHLLHLPEELIFPCLFGEPFATTAATAPLTVATSFNDCERVKGCRAAAPSAGERRLLISTTTDYPGTSCELGRERRKVVLSKSNLSLRTSRDQLMLGCVKEDTVDRRSKSTWRSSRRSELEMTSCCFDGGEMSMFTIRT